MQTSKSYFGISLKNDKVQPEFSFYDFQEMLTLTIYVVKDFFEPLQRFVHFLSISSLLAAG